MSETRDYFYSVSWQVLEERVNGATTAERQFVWGLRYVDDVVLGDRDTTGSGALNERFFGIQDPNWNLTAIADTTGTIQERYGYDPYGMPIVMTAGFVGLSASLYDREVLDTGYRWHKEVCLYQVRYRAYHPQLGAWTQRDPLPDYLANFYLDVEG